MFIPLSAAMAMTSAKWQAPNKTQIDDQLSILWYRSTSTSNPPGFIFEDAQASYGPSTLTCDRLIVDLEEGHKHMVAEGHVHILDIDATLDADRVFIDWIDHTGSAQNIDVNLHGFMVHAKAAILFPKNAELDDIVATPCGGESTPIVEIRAPRAVVDKNGDGRIYKPTLYLLGHKTITLPVYSISQAHKSTSQPLPSIEYSRGSGFQEGWTPGLLLNDTTAINGNEHLGQHAEPADELLVTKSLLPPTAALGGFVPYTDFNPRFAWSYFENSYIPTPAAEEGFTLGRRTSLSVETLWNEDPVARPVNVPFNKPVNVILESAAPVGHVGLYGQLDAQRLDEIGGPRVDRVEGFTSVTLPQANVLPRLYTDIRFDGFATMGQEPLYGWFHGQFGLVSKPNRHIRLGFAYMRGANFGTPLFESDELYKLQSFNGRVDLEYGPRELTLLAKEDPFSGRVYDYEVEFQQAVKCFQPFVIYRTFPRGLIFGFRMRLDDVIDALKRRGVIKGPLPSEDR